MNNNNNNNNININNINSLEGEIENLSNYFIKKSKENIKSWLITSLLITIVFCFVIGIAIYIISITNKNIDTTRFPFNINSETLFSMFIILTIVGAYLYVFLTASKSTGISSLKIKVNGNESELNNKMNEILKYLYYKEKTYKGRKVFYAYKERWAFNINITSLKRYLEYYIENGELRINVWASIYGKELPIDNKRMGFYHKKALVYDLEYIKENINK